MKTLKIWSKFENLPANELFPTTGIMFSTLELAVVWNVIPMVVNEMRWLFFVAPGSLLSGVIWTTYTPTQQRKKTWQKNCRIKRNKQAHKNKLKAFLFYKDYIWIRSYLYNGKRVIHQRLRRHHSLTIEQYFWSLDGLQRRLSYWDAGIQRMYKHLHP